MSIIRTARKQCLCHNIIEVEVGTTSPTDPHAYKGGKTYIRLQDGKDVGFAVIFRNFLEDWNSS